MKKKSKISRIEKALESEEYNWELITDTRNAHFRGKVSYNTKNLKRIGYIKEKKDKQRQDQLQDPLFKFNQRIAANQTW